MKKFGITTIILTFISIQIYFTSNAQEFMINQYITYTQCASKATANTEEIFTVVWQSHPNALTPWEGQDGDGAGVYARQFYIDGTPIGDEFQVNTTWIGWQDHPAIASDTNGNFIVVWGSYMQDGDGYGVFGQRYSLDCTPIGEEFQVNTITEGDQGYDPIVAADDEGNFVVAWSSGNDSDTSDIYARYYNALGIPMGDEFRVNTFLNFEQYFPHIDMNSSGEFVIIWQSLNQDGSGRGVYGQRYDPDCTPIGEEFRVNSYTEDNQQNAIVTIFPDGGFAAVWASYLQDGSSWGVYARVFDANGNPIGDDFRVNEFTENHQGGMEIDSDAEGNFIITWNSYELDGDARGVYSKRYNSLGISLCHETQVNQIWEYDQGRPTVACNDAGDFFITWDSEHSDIEPDHMWDDVWGNFYSSISVTPRNIVFTAETGDNDSRLEPGESGALSIRIQNTGEELENVTALLETEDIHITITDPNGSYGTLPINTILGNDDDPFQITLSQQAEPHLAHFTLTISGDASTTTIPLEMYVGRSNILLVDDDQNNPREYYLPNYETYYAAALDSLSRQYEHWDLVKNENYLPTPLSDYDKVIWFTADTDTNTLTSYDMEELSNFLDDEGKLFITGQNIGADIFESSFYTDYLHAQFIQDDYNAPIYAIQGIMGDPIGDDFVNVIQGEYGANNQISPDIIEPTEGAYKTFNYSMTEEYGAGIRWAGDYSVVYLPFSFEAIIYDYQRENLMERVLNWLDNASCIESEDIACLPAKFELCQNFPNPFNPATTIQFEIPVASQRAVKLQIYDISGKLINTLIDKPMEHGYHSVVWNGKDDNEKNVASGMYFYRIEADRYRETKSMLLLK